MMSISIAMCTYNGEMYLQDQLDSIAKQTRLPDELVICDDNSSDHSLIIVEKFLTQSSFPVKIYKNQTNIGSTKNFEKAISLCGGDIIALADQDDVWHVDKLNITEESFCSSTNIGVVFSNGNCVDENLLCFQYPICLRWGFH